MTGSSMKIVLPDTDSERHPDIAVYLTKPPYGGQPWRDWVPSLVLEVVSESSVERDYSEKPTDYWNAGVQEYVIVDRFRRIVQVQTRGESTWVITTLARGQAYTSALLPGFTLDVTALFDAARV
jgi:Uma2 family endonuclease